jgi:hypothetical protein
MTTFITVFFGGGVSALVTLVLGQPLQHYFWQRQRHAERQIAAIEEMSALTAELQFLVMHQPEEINTRREQLFTTLLKVTTSVDNRFSRAAWDQFSPALQSMEEILQEPPLSAEQRTQRYTQLLRMILEAHYALYRDMGIPSKRWWTGARMRRHLS